MNQFLTKSTNNSKLQLIFFTEILKILDDTPVGEMIVVLSGEAFALAGAQEAIVAAGIELTVLKRGA